MVSKSLPHVRDPARHNVVRSAATAEKEAANGDRKNPRWPL